MLPKKNKSIKYIYVKIKLSLWILNKFVAI